MCQLIPIDQYPITPVSLIQRYLYGVNLCGYPDEIFDNAIRAATALLEDQLGIAIMPRTFYGGEDGDVPGLMRLPTEMDEFGRFGSERQDWVPQDGYRFLKLNFRPLIGAPTRVRFVYPGVTQGYPTIPLNWISVKDGNTATIEITAAANSPSTLVFGLLSSSQLYMFGGWWSYRIPNFIRVDYRAGFEIGCVPFDIQQAIGLGAANDVLNIAGDLIAGAGIASSSISLGGLSQSIATTSSATNAGYGARIIQYTKQRDQLVKALIAKYQGFNLVVV